MNFKPNVSADREFHSQFKSTDVHTFPSEFVEHIVSENKRSRTKSKKPRTEKKSQVVNQTRSNSEDSPNSSSLQSKSSACPNFGNEDAIFSLSNGNDCRNIAVEESLPPNENRSFDEGGCELVGMQSRRSESLDCDVRPLVPDTERCVKL
jgi:hypothetical protein